MEQLESSIAALESTLHHVDYWAVIVGAVAAISGAIAAVCGLAAAALTGFHFYYDGQLTPLRAERDHGKAVELAATNERSANILRAMQPRRLMVPPDAPPERKAQIDELNRAVAGPVLPNTQGARFRGMLVLLQAVPDFDALTLMRDLSENLLSLHWWSVRPPEVLSVRTNVLDPPPGIDAAEVKQGITVAVRKLSGTLDDSEERVRDAATALARLLTAYDLGGDEVKPIEDQRAPEKTVVVRIGAKPLPLSETQRALSATPSAAPR